MAVHASPSPRIIQNITMSKPLVVLLTLENESFDGVFDSVHARLLPALRQRTTFQRPETVPDALRWLTSSVRPRAVIVGDPALHMTQYRDVLWTLVDYVKAGGTVVYADILSSWSSPQQFRALFDAFDLPWRYDGKDESKTFTASPHCIRLDKKQHARKCTMMAACLSGVHPRDAVYLKQHEILKLNEKAHTSTLNGATVDTPAAFAAVGKGRLGYVGDINGGKDTADLVMAMCLAPGMRAPSFPGSNLPASSASVSIRLRSATTRTNARFQSAKSTSATQSDAPSSPPTDAAPILKPTILVLSLLKEEWIDELYAQVYAGLRANATVIEARDKATALSHLSSPPFSSPSSATPNAVLVSDAAITGRKYSSILNALIPYAMAGGRVVLGMMFSNHLPLGETAAAFFTKWGVPWLPGSYHRTNFALNPAGVPAPLSADAFFPTMNIKTVHIAHAPLSTAVYLPAEGSRVQSHVFAPTPITGARAQESPAVFAPVGKGYLGFVGDVNAEESATRIIIEMCGVKLKPGDLGSVKHTSSVEFRPDGSRHAVYETVAEQGLPRTQGAKGKEPTPLRPPRAREAEVGKRQDAKKEREALRMKEGEKLKNEVSTRVHALSCTDDFTLRVMRFSSRRNGRRRLRRTALRLSRAPLALSTWPISQQLCSSSSCAYVRIFYRSPRLQ